MMAVMERVARTPLDGWMAGRLRLAESALTRDAIDSYHLRCLRETVSWAADHCPFYASRLGSKAGATPNSFEEFARLPFTSPEDLRGHAADFLCVSQDKIARIVTVHSSGTTGAPKRVFFTADDQERALEFFSHGVRAFAGPGDRMLIALPGEREGSVGYQLAKGVGRAGVTPIPHGLIDDPARALERMNEEQATCIIGLPVQVFQLSQHRSALAEEIFKRLHAIVLCSDHVPEAIVRELRSRNGCRIFQHYGSVEMGLGGGVDCAAHMGYHMREADLYFEIVSPETGAPVPDGSYGEVVFTSLGREGMPLIRYRTGDLSRILSEQCGCGSLVRRLDRIARRVGGPHSLESRGDLTISELDEALFAVPGVLDFSASLRTGAPNILHITMYGTSSESAVHKALRAVAAIKASETSGELRLKLSFAAAPFPVTGAKRCIQKESTR